MNMNNAYKLLALAEALFAGTWVDRFFTWDHYDPADLAIAAALLLLAGINVDRR